MDNLAAVEVVGSPAEEDMGCGLVEDSLGRAEVDSLVGDSRLDPEEEDMLVHHRAMVPVEEDIVVEDTVVEEVGILVEAGSYTAGVAGVGRSHLAGPHSNRCWTLCKKEKREL